MFVGCLFMNGLMSYLLFFFFNDTATTEIYTLSLHDALPIWLGRGVCIDNYDVPIPYLNFEDTYSVRNGSETGFEVFLNYEAHSCSFGGFVVFRRVV